MTACDSQPLAISRVLGIGLFLLCACARPVSVATAKRESPPLVPVTSPQPATPPFAPVREVTDVYFGTQVVDPYRWMEANSDELSAWLKGQADFTQRILTTLPLHDALHARVHELNDVGVSLHSAQRRGPRLFYLKRAPGDEVFKLCIRDAGSGDERVLVDPASKATRDTTYSIDYFEPSPDGKLVAYGLSPNGSEQAVLHVLDVADGHELPEQIDRARYAFVSWQPDGRAFFYKRDRLLPPDAPESEHMLKARVHRHVLGEAPDRDVALFGHGVSLHVDVPPKAFPMIWSPPVGAHVFALFTEGVRAEPTVYVAKREALAGAKTPWKKIIDARDDVVDVAVHGDQLYLRTHRGAERFNVLRMSLAQPSLARAVTVVPESSLVIREIAAAKDALYLRVLDAGVTRLQRLAYDTGKLTEVPLPAAGTISDLYAATDEPGAVFVLTSWTLSPRLMRYDPQTAALIDTAAIPPSPADFSKIVAQELKVPAVDGTLVPLSVIAQSSADTAPRPTLLVAYGAYGNVAEPRFDPMLLAWLERGGIQAVCHPRGGGVLGEGWHDTSKLATKPNTVSDTLACARALLERGLTTPPLLAAEGTSAGGIAVGGAITAKPELFGAAVIRVGMTNALRFEQLPIGPMNTMEFGTVATPEGFEMLRAVDAYHHVQNGTSYPAVLLTAGIADPRVSPWQAAKMTARLQAATASKQPVLLRVDYGAGHGNGSAQSNLEAERADKYTFLLRAAVR